MTTRHSVALACLAFAASGCGATTHAQHSCAGPSSCAAGESCVRAVCAPPGSPSLARDLGRVVLEPEAAVFVSAADGARSVRQVAALPLGARSRILVAFAPPATTSGIGGPSDVRAAYLVLDRSPSPTADVVPVTLRASTIDEAWSPGVARDRGDPSGGALTTWASPPHAVAIESATLTTSAVGEGSLRLDVTSYARLLVGRDPSRARGLRVEASGEGDGVAIATGSVAGARGPRLEIYFTR
jgi:hypothetical protein